MAVKERTPPPASKLKYHVKRSRNIFRVIENGGDYKNKIVVESTDKKEAYSICKTMNVTQQWRHNSEPYELMFRVVYSICYRW